MWAVFLEWCANVVAATRGRGRVSTVFALALAVLLAATFLAEWGLVGLLPVAFAGVVVVLLGRDVLVAREQAWKAATLPLDHPKQPPRWHRDDSLAAPSAAALYRLADAVDHARRGRAADANESLARVDLALLAPEDRPLVEAVRALISVALGEPARAAQQAAAALPTGSHALDEVLGRVVLADAWADEDRLRAIEAAWAKVDDAAPLGTLRQLARIRIDPAVMDELDAPRARVLEDVARSVGDEDLAAELAMRGRESSAYR